MFQEQVQRRQKAQAPGHRTAQSHQSRFMHATRSFGRAALQSLQESCWRRTLKKATSRAYRELRRQSEHGADALFDIHFLNHRGGALLRGWQQGYPPSPAELAQACVEQWGFRGDKRAAFVDTLTPIAARFLSLLERELSGPAARERPQRQRLASRRQALYRAAAAPVRETSKNGAERL